MRHSVLWCIKQQTNTPYTLLSDLHIGTFPVHINLTRNPPGVYSLEITATDVFNLTDKNIISYRSGYLTDKPVILHSLIIERPPLLLARLASQGQSLLNECPPGRSYPNMLFKAVTLLVNMRVCAQHLKLTLIQPTRFEV